MSDNAVEDAPESTGGGAGLHVRVDHELCGGMGYCHDAAPTVFELRSDDKSWVRDHVDWSTVDRAEVQEAASMCPWRAIEVTED